VVRVAVFPGTFDPFTVGHKDIVCRALQCVADEVIVAVGVNADKKCGQTVEERIRVIEMLYEDEPRVRVEAYEGLTVDFAQRVNAAFLLRGVRSVKDFEYERDIAEVNRRLTGIETVLLYCDPALACISSSMVRELRSYGREI
jgi:pantetheine-phosphate adenylyltransferase